MVLLVNWLITLIKLINRSDCGVLTSQKATFFIVYPQKLILHSLFTKVNGHTKWKQYKKPGYMILSLFRVSLRVLTGHLSKVSAIYIFSKKVS